MSKFIKFSHALLILNHLFLYQCFVSASHVSLPNSYNSLPDSVTFAAPLPCDSPPLSSFGAPVYNHPPIQFSTTYPLSYSSAPHFKYAVAAPPTFVKYASEPRIKVYHGAPVTTTFTTAVGFSAPPVQSNVSPLGVQVPPYALPQATFVAPTSSYGSAIAYAAPPNFFRPSSYAGLNLLSSLPPVKGFRAPLPVNTYSYGVPNAVW